MSSLAARAIVLVALTCGVAALNNGLALTPPMGWSTWNTFACDYDESTIRQMADLMVSTGMLAAGYEYLNLDDCWEGERDASGMLTYNSTKFPSGIPALADYIHSKGLKFGMYSSSGPYTCQNYTGSWKHEREDAKVFASWNVDFLKLDCCWMDNIADRETAYTAMSQGLLDSGRPIVFSCDTDELIEPSGNMEFPWIWGPQWCNMARIAWDINDHWSTTLRSLAAAVNVGGASQPGYWNDLDILTVGMGGQTLTEYKSQFSLWSVVASPLLAGNDLRIMDSETLAILTAPEVIAVNQDALGKGGQRIWYSDDGSQEVWARPLNQNFTHAVVLFNRGSVPAEILVDLWLLYDNFLCCQYHPPSSFYHATVRDLWARKDLGVSTGNYTAVVEPHGVVMVKITKVESPRQ